MNLRYLTQNLSCQLPSNACDFSIRVSWSAQCILFTLEARDQAISILFIVIEAKRGGQSFSKRHSDVVRKLFAVASDGSHISKYPQTDNNHQDIYNLD